MAKQSIPKIWRKAKVIAVEKPGKDPKLAASYCPILLRSTCYKLLERLALQCTSHTVEELLSPDQAIFRKAHPAWGRGTTFALLLSIRFLIFCSFYFSLYPFLIHFTYFLLLSIPSLSTRIVPLCFLAGGRRRRPNLGLVCFVYYCVVCIT